MSTSRIDLGRILPPGSRGETLVLVKPYDKNRVLSSFVTSSTDLHLTKSRLLLEFLELLPDYDSSKLETIPMSEVEAYGKVVTGWAPFRFVEATSSPGFLYVQFEDGGSPLVEVSYGQDLDSLTRQLVGQASSTFWFPSRFLQFYREKIEKFHSEVG